MSATLCVASVVCVVEPVVEALFVFCAKEIVDTPTVKAKAAMVWRTKRLLMRIMMRVLYVVMGGFPLRAQCNKTRITEKTAQFVLTGPRSVCFSVGLLKIR